MWCCITFALSFPMGWSPGSTEAHGTGRKMSAMKKNIDATPLTRRQLCSCCHGLVSLSLSSCPLIFFVAFMPFACMRSERARCHKSGIGWFARHAAARVANRPISTPNAVRIVCVDVSKRSKRTASTRGALGATGMSFFPIAWQASERSSVAPPAFSSASPRPPPTGSRMGFVSH